MQTAQKAQVTLDGETYFDATVYEEDWNGFKIPYFDHKVALEVVTHINESVDDERWEPNADGTFTQFGWEDGKGMTEQETVAPTADGLVSIGGRCYCWEAR